jgi:hypothetical protein
MGSYLENSAGQETWPDAQAVVSCGLIDPSLPCEEETLAPDALTAQGVPQAGSTVDATDGGGGQELGGALSVTSASWCLLLCFTRTEHWYDITAENAEASGYTVVQPADEAGLDACAATLRCFIPVGVDWRLSAATDATAVLDVINNVIAATHADRVDIVAHSQGGLVLNALVHDPGSVGKIYRIVTLGTPYLGAPQVLSELLYAQPCEIPWSKLGMSGCVIAPTIVQGLAENYPGVADLAPSAAYYQAISALTEDSGGTEVGLSYAQAQSVIAQTLLSPPPGSGLTSRDDSLMEQAATFHSQVDDWAPLDPTVGLLRMVGYDASPPATSCSQAPCSGSQVGEFNESGTIVSVSTSGQPQYGTGDGTVPLYSANVYDPAAGLDDRGNAHDMYWCAVSHMGLAWSTPVWQTAVAYLDGSSSYATDQLGPGGGCPDGTLGSLAGLNLIGSATAQPAGAVTPGPVSDTSCSPGKTRAAPIPTSITVENNSTTDSIDLYWYDPSCREELYATIPPQMQLQQSAYAGDVWHLKSPSTGLLLGTVTAVATPQTVVAQ